MIAAGVKCNAKCSLVTCRNLCLVLIFLYQTEDNFCFKYVEDEVRASRDNVEYYGFSVI